jgi:hypothetical protein
MRLLKMKTIKRKSSVYMIQHSKNRWGNDIHFQHNCKKKKKRVDYMYWYTIKPFILIILINNLVTTGRLCKTNLLEFCTTLFLNPKNDMNAFFYLYHSRYQLHCQYF